MNKIIIPGLSFMVIKNSVGHKLFSDKAYIADTESPLIV